MGGITSGRRNQQGSKPDRAETQLYRGSVHREPVAGRHNDSEQTNSLRKGRWVIYVICEVGGVYII